MQVYQFAHGQQIEGLKRIERAPREPGPNEVRVRVRAVSLNYRDLMCVKGFYPQSVPHPIVPASDCAGEVLSVGAGVTAFKPGDKIANTFFHNWDDGSVALPKVMQSFGGNVDGVLAEELVLPQNRLALLPAELDFTEGATLTCAGVTAWNALFVSAQLRPGAKVLLLGTGGVSIWALQLARAAGYEVLITSSSDEKLERARALGAHHLINYRKTPEWQDEVLRLTGGVDLVVEVGGAGTLARSIASAGMGGTIAIIGGVSGFGAAADFSPRSLLMGAKHMVGIFVGSRAMLQDLSRFVGLHAIKPVVDRAFGFDQAQDAYRHLESGSHFGKVVIRVGK